MANKDSLGDRMKRYEGVNRTYGLVNTPMIIRVDGKAFHTFTKGYNRPFDMHLINAMANAAQKTAATMQGFKLAYVQSDEVTFLLSDLDSHETQPWFDYNIQKIVSITAATMSVYFRDFIQCAGYPVFDARAFNVPHNEVANAFLWRVKDWRRNSVQMYGRAHFSQKQLHGKKIPDIMEMLEEKGFSWQDDLQPVVKNGTFIYESSPGYWSKDSSIEPTYVSVSEIVGRVAGGLS